MRLLGHRGTRVHAPENSLDALISAYTMGANGVEFDLQMTLDGYLVLSHDGTTDRLTGQPGTISELSLDALRRYDFSGGFSPSPAFRYYRNPSHRLQISTLDTVLEQLPVLFPKLIEVKPEATLTAERRRAAVEALVRSLKRYEQLDVAVVYSMDPDVLRLLRLEVPGLRVATFDYRLTPADQLALLEDVGADGLVADAQLLLTSGSELTDFGRALQDKYRGGQLRVGAAVYPYRAHGPWELNAAEHDVLAGMEFVWSVAVDSLANGSGVAHAEPWFSSSFAGRDVDTTSVAFGYAKANPFCHVFQDDGVHVAIKPYDGHPAPVPATSSDRERLSRLEEQMTYVATDWPYYSGGGVGLLRPIRGDFSAEVNYWLTEPMAQAMTLEMALLNVDPGAHQAPWNPDGTPRLPRSFRDKDSFFDPHGAPPYVGVEHDEDDGYRINWNLGTEYDNNQYGRPIGDGRTPRNGRLRLERRGSLFSAYYRNNVEAPDWICVGVVRNESLNRTAFLRCVAKRWRQELTGGTGFQPIRSNEFVFSNLIVTRHAWPESFHD